MSESRPESTSPGLSTNSDLETVLAAWHEATLRLEQTHEILQSEVRRLSDELEIKNRQLERKNRMADLGEVASYVAHEVRNHLVPVSLYVDLLKRRCATDTKSLEIADKVATCVEALENTVSDLLNFAADPNPTPRPVQLDCLVRDVVDSLGEQLNAQGIETTVEMTGDTTVHVDADMTRSVLLNLVFNAMDAMPEGGEIVISGEACGSDVELEVADSGPGLTDDVRAHLFEPFYTTKRDGTGLGLAHVERIVRAHGARIRVRNCPEGGAAFTIQFPKTIALEAAA
ncbi:MAG: sensor histidine kinase [Planctomycetota bacterium]|nr:MAG: sensor histidine kinase [Planctomycetota bacterium]REK44481.1 MAG: sensor histidine kinase [Planctomycetota bacterium]